MPSLKWSPLGSGENDIRGISFQDAIEPGETVTSFDVEIKSGQGNYVQIVDKYLGPGYRVIGRFENITHDVDLIFSIKTAEGSTLDEERRLKLRV